MIILYSVLLFKNSALHALSHTQFKGVQESDLIFWFDITVDITDFVNLTVHCCWSFLFLHE